MNLNSYGRPTTYERITPDRGCGFILKRIYDLTEAPGRERFAWPMKQDIYHGTKWANRPGFASLLWSSLIKDGLIESDGGMQEYKCYSFFNHSHVGTRAAGIRGCGAKYTVRYHLTSKGRGVLFDMMDRVNAKNKIQSKLNTVGSVAEFDTKKDEERNTPTKEQVECQSVILQKEAVHCANLAADYITKTQKLRAEKNDLKERFKKIAARLEWLENEISDIRNVLTEIIG